MLHVIQLDLMRAIARHHPNGTPKDPQDRHRRDMTLRRRAASSRAWHAALARLRAVLQGSRPDGRLAARAQPPKC